MVNNCPARMFRSRDRRRAVHTVTMPSSNHPQVPASPAARFSPELMYAAARLYYVEDATQAQVAASLGTSRATVSRLLSEARRHGIVSIDVRPPAASMHSDLAARTASALALEQVHLSAGSADSHLGATLAPPLSAALRETGLDAGDVLLVASGRSLYEASQFELPRLPGVVVVPTVGGQDETEPWYHTNEIARAVAAKIGGSPAFLHAPALPGTDLYSGLQREPSIRRVLALWRKATCAVVGIGAPPSTRESISDSVPKDVPGLDDAVGDICLRFFDRTGEPIAYPGIERLMALELSDLKKMPAVIALAVGPEKVAGIIAAARMGYVNRLVTDSPTAILLLAATSEESA